MEWNWTAPSLITVVIIQAALWSASSAFGQEQINVRNKNSVMRAYKGLLRTAKVNPEWQGSLKAGRAGGVSVRYQAATLKAVNFYRSMAGLGPVVFREDWSAKAASAALIMAAANKLDHTPPEDWEFWSPDGYEAASHSNLSRGDAGARGIAGYIEDEGDNNKVVGHRTWILYPNSKEMGSGNAYFNKNGSDGYGTNALWVHQEQSDDPDPETDEFGLPPEFPTRDGFVAWPPPGFVPNTLVHRRWSFSKAEADFTTARISMRDGKKRVRARVVGRASGYGDPTVVFEPRWKLRTNPYFSQKIDDSTHVLMSGKKKKRVRVTVTGVEDYRTGATQSFTYRVIIIPVRVPKNYFAGEETP